MLRFIPQLPSNWWIVPCAMGGGVLWVKVIIPAAASLAKAVLS